MNDEQARELRRAIEAGFKELRVALDRIADELADLPGAGDVAQKLDGIRQALGSSREGSS